MTKKAALIVDAQRIFSHEYDDDHFLVLGLTFQLAFTDGFDESTSADSRWTKLWRWDRITHVDLRFQDSTGQGATIPNVELWKLANAGPQPQAPVPMLDALDKRVDQLLSDARATGFLWTPNNPDRALPTEGHILQMQAATSRVATKVPYLINLAGVVAIKKNDIPYPGHVLPQNVQVYAAPRLRWSWAIAGPEKASFNPSLERFVFNTSALNAADVTLLDGGTIPGTVLTAFTTSSIPLTRAAVAAPVTAGSEWKITDGRQTFSLHQLGALLNVSVPRSTLDRFLFSAAALSAADVTQLNGGTIPAVVLAEFSANNIPLTGAAMPATVTAGIEWTVTELGQTFSLIQIADSLNVAVVPRDGEMFEWRYWASGVSGDPAKIPELTAWLKNVDLKPPGQDGVFINLTNCLVRNALYHSQAVLFEVGSLTAAEITQLDGGTLPTKVTDSFSTNGIVLSAASVVETVTPGSAWTIADAGPSYQLMIESGVLRIYGPEAGESLETSDDWMGRLTERVAEKWDLARHLLDSVNDLVSMPISDYMLYWNMILAALRDRAGAGLIDSTDGHGLLKFAIQTLYPINTEETQGRLIRDGQLRSLQAWLYDRERSLFESTPKKWIEWLTSSLPSELAVGLDTPNAPNRMLKFTWPIVDPSHPEITPIFPSDGSQPTIHLRLFSSRNASTPIPHSTDPEFFIKNVNGQRSRGSDGTGEFAFDGYVQAVPLPAGWYEAVVIDGASNPASERIFLGSRVAEDFLLLSRLWTTLQDPKHLAKVVSTQWTELATGDSRLKVTTGTTSAEWYASVWTDVNTSSTNYDVVSHRAGDIRPFDGRTWVLSLCDIRHPPAWPHDTQYKCKFTTPAFDPSGNPTAISQIEILVTLKNDGAGKHVVVSTGGSAPPLDIPAAGDPYHLRFECSRSGLSNIRVAIFGATGDLTTSHWLIGPKLELASQVFSRLDFRVDSIGVDVDAETPSLLTSLGSLTDNSAHDTAMSKSWFTSLHPGKQLWDKIASELSKQGGLEAGLAKLDLVKKLSLGQTARLVTVWHKQLPNNRIDYLTYLTGNQQYIEGGPNNANARPGKLGEQLVKYWLQRMDVTGGYANSPYRDFLPMCSAGALHDDIEAKIAAYLGTLGWLFSKTAIRRSDAELFSEQPTDLIRSPIPHSVNFQIDRSAMFNDSVRGQEDDDYLRNIAGFGLMLRRARTGAGPAPAHPDDYFTNQTWRVLNTSDIGALDSALHSPPVLFEVAISSAGPITAADVALLDDNTATVPNGVLQEFTNHNKQLSAAARKSKLVHGRQWQIVDEASDHQLLFFTLERTDTDSIKALVPVVNQWYDAPTSRVRVVASPVPLQYQDNTRQTTLTYRNKHLSAHSPVEDIAHAFEFGHDDYEQTPPPLMSLSPSPPQNGPDWSILPLLKFGQIYQAMPYVIGNCCNLPAILTGASGHPTILRETDLTDADLHQLSEPDIPNARWPRDSRYIRRFKYLRRVGVGLPRVQRSESPDDPSNKALENDKNVFPIIPKDVRPLAREWGIQGLTPIEPWVRFLYDSSTQSGKIESVSAVNNWMLVVPRVTVAGQSDDDNGPDISFDLFIGLRNHVEKMIALVPGQSCGAVIQRRGTELRVRGISFLFTSAAFAQPDLDAMDSGTIPQVVKQAFAANGPALTNTATIAVVSRTSEWTIADAGATFVVKNNGATLDCFETNAQMLLRQGQFLFASAAFQQSDITQLNAGTVPGIVHQAFTANTIEINPNPRVVVLTAGDEWKLRSGTTDYLIRKRAGALGIYSDSEALLHPDVGLLSSGPLDFRVTYTGSQVYVAWRRSDSQEPWNEWAPAITSLRNLSPANGNSWVIVERLDDLSSKTSVTIGTPEYATGSVALSKDTRPRPLEHGLSLRPLEVAETTIILPQKPNSPFDFYLRQSATDLETWDAWPKALPEQNLGILRKAVWGRHKLLSGPVGDADRFDCSIDDPAIESLRIELVPLRVDPDVRCEVESFVFTPSTIASSINNDPLHPGIRPNPLNPVQRLAKRIQILSLNLEEAIPNNRLNTADPSKVVIRVREQEIWELRVYPLVKNSYFVKSNEPEKQTFHSQFAQDVGLVENGQRAMAPWRLTIEVPTREIVSIPEFSKEVDERAARVLALQAGKLAEWNNQWLKDREAILLSAISPSFDGQSVSVSLIKPTPRAFRYAGQVRLIRQVWRWRGRPLPPFPFSAKVLEPFGLDAFPPYKEKELHKIPKSELETPAYPMLWDAAGFGDRSPIDLLDEMRLVTSETRFSPLFREELGEDRRSIYYRFTAQALSRYAGLYNDNPPLVMASESTRDPDQNGHNAWRRLIVPCRREEKPSRPSIRFVLPLTQSEQDNALGKVPGILVVLDDPWFSFGGLGETLEAEIVRTADWWDTDRGVNADIDPVIRPEFGPDPTLTGRGWTKNGFDPSLPPLPGPSSPYEQETHHISVPDQSLMMDIVGPIGHTFDTDADAPFFNASSFILRPPHTSGHLIDTGVPPNPLDWYFAKLRFRRNLPAESMFDYRVEAPKSLAEQPHEIEIPGSDTPQWNNNSWVLDFAEVEIDRASFGKTTISVLSAVNASGGNFDIGQICVENGLRTEGSLTYDFINIRFKSLNSGNASPQVDLFKSDIASSVQWTRASLSVRLVLQRESEKPIPCSDSIQMCHLTVQFRVNGVWGASNSGSLNDGTMLAATVRNAVWHSLESQKWSGSWPKKLKLESEGAVSISPVSVYPCRNSDFTAPYWIQFAPDSNQLISSILEGDSDRKRLTLQWQKPAAKYKIQRTDQSKLESPPTDVELQLSSGGVAQTPLDLLTAVARIEFAGGQYRLWLHFDGQWNLQPFPDHTEWKILEVQEYGEPKDWPNATLRLPRGDVRSDQYTDITSKFRVVLTELVSDVRGQLGEERYLGLYEVNYDGFAVEVQRSPVLGLFRPDQHARGRGRRLRLRVVEFQVVNIKKDKRPNGQDASPTLHYSVWSELFPSRDEREPVDALTRIVRVSSPIELSEG